MSSDATASDVSKSPAPPAPPRRIIALCAASLAAGIGVANWLEVRGSSSYGGSLQSLNTSITADHESRIDEISIVPGQRIVPGDKLLQFADDDLLARLTSKQRELTELEADLKRVQAKADVELEWRRRELNNEIFQTQMKVSVLTQERTAKQVEQLAWQDHLKNLQGERIGPDLADITPAAGRAILDSPFADERRLQAILREDAAAIAIEGLTNQLALCEAQLERLKKVDNDLTEKVRLSMGVNLVETQIGRAREELSALEKQKDSLTISSPAHGIVGMVYHRPGDLVKPGEPIVELLDDERRHLVAQIPSSAATRLRQGTRVGLVFPGRQSRIGLVAMIPPHAIPANQQAPAEDSQVEVKIEPAGKLWPKLPVGSRVQVRVQQ